MTPPCKIFKADDLEGAVQSSLGGMKRKTEGGRNIDLSQCPLFSMVQYDCQIDRPDLPHSPVQCFQVQRWFRRCQDKKGAFMVETTNWEDREEKLAASSSVADAGKTTGQHGAWLHSWRERELNHEGQYRDR
ncbi:hypothetical protein SUNI508_02970 [Seiridium unicorne]|uniref:Uncharacterized protein n=1 Tax=Seiridium unicorne TaxID=138068 RepID=A0ABR2VGH9_9PEZI